MAAGFAMVRQRGSHRQYRHADGRGTTVPFHSHDISPTLLRKIALTLLKQDTSFKAGIQRKRKRAGWDEEGARLRAIGLDDPG